MIFVLRMHRQIAENIYLIVLAITTLLAIARHHYKGVIFIAAYCLTMLVAEITTTKLLPTGVYNHYVYAIAMLLTAGILFSYYAYVLHNIVAYIIGTICSVIILLVYFINHMWLPETIIPVKYIAAYYTIHAVLSALFIWGITVHDRYKDERIHLWFGSAFMVYSTIAMLNDSVVFAKTLIPIDEIISEVSYNVLNTIFYTVLSVILLRMRNAYQNR